MYSRKPGVVYGFHATDKSIAPKILNLKESFHFSENDHDWLGRGIYFWESNYERAIQFGEEAKLRKFSSIQDPCVLGAIIDLGNCLDLLDHKHLNFVKKVYENIEQEFKSRNINLPKNKQAASDDFDLLLRNLDCAVIRAATQIAEDAGTTFDTVRAVFWEGKELYPSAGFKEKNHIQIAVLNLNCIKGIFLPKEKVSDDNAW